MFVFAALSATRVWRLLSVWYARLFVGRTHRSVAHTTAKHGTLHALLGVITLSHLGLSTCTRCSVLVRTTTNITTCDSKSSSTIHQSASSWPPCVPALALLHTNGFTLARCSQVAGNLRRRLRSMAGWFVARCGTDLLNMLFGLRELFLVCVLAC